LDKLTNLSCTYIIIGTVHNASKILPKDPDATQASAHSSKLTAYV
jgi:hypothetical protein